MGTIAGNTAEPEEQTGQRVSTLSNSIHWYLEKSFIQEQTNGKFQLIALTGNGIIFFDDYKTLRGAKIAFTKFLKYRGWKKNGIKPFWTHFYEPEAGWLEGQLKETESRSIAD